MVNQIKPVEAVKEINVLIASPSDCGEYRTGMAAMIEFWNETAGKKEKIRFRPRMYEKHSVATSGKDGQTVINEQLIIGEVQACVAFFHAKVGWPTQHYPSGTVEEIDVCARMGIKPGIHFWTGFDATTDDGKKLVAYKRSIEDDPNKPYYQKFDTPIEAVTKGMKSVLVQASALEGIDLDVVLDTTVEVNDPETNQGISFTEYFKNFNIVTENIGSELHKFTDRQNEGANKDFLFTVNSCRAGWVLENQTQLPIRIHSYDLMSVGIDDNFRSLSEPVKPTEISVVEPGEEFEFDIVEYDTDCLTTARVEIDYSIGNHRIEGTVLLTLDLEAEEENEYQEYMEHHLGTDWRK